MKRNCFGTGQLWYNIYIVSWLGGKNAATEIGDFWFGTGPVISHQELFHERSKDIKAS